MNFQTTKMMTPQQIAEDLVLTINNKTYDSNEDFVQKVTTLITKRIERLYAEKNSCGIWCPLCGAHLLSPNK